MERRMKDVLRAGATAVGVATGLMALASTAQTPDGYIHASFGGPLAVFTNDSSSDVLAIGDGVNDSAELASLLKGPLGPDAREGAPNSPFRVAFEAGSAGSAATTDDTDAGGSLLHPSLGSVTVLPSADPSAAPLSQDVTMLPSKPVVDSHGKVDCSGAVSCHTDATTNVTTVTYPDGVVAIVQKINDLTVVAYKTITDVLPSEISSILPTSPPLLAVGPPAAVPAQAPASEPIAVPDPVSPPAISEAVAPPIDPAPPVSDIDVDAPSTSGPRTNITRPSNDFSPGKNGLGPNTGTNNPGADIGGKVKETIGGMVDAVTGAVGKALKPGASATPGSSTSTGATDNSNGANNP